MQKVIFLDGNSILNRAYYALPALTTSQGQHVNAILGFLNILIKVLDEEKPTKLVVAFDKRGQNFRKELYEGYKSNRKGMPDELAEQMPILQNLLQLMQVTYVDKAGVEADDIIGTLSKRCEGQKILLTGDKDLLQLIDDTTTVLLTKKGVSEVDRLDKDSLKTEFDLSPQQIVEYKAICGDASDCIPGVNGIGQKGALKLLQAYGDLDGVYANIDSITGSTNQKLILGKQMAYLSKRLATIDTEADVICDLSKCGLPVFDNEVKKELERLEFRSLIKRLTFVDQADALPVETNDTPKLVTITQQAELNQLLQEGATASDIAIFWDNDLYIAFDKSKEYMLTSGDNFLSGLTIEYALRTLRPLLNNDKPKTVYDGKGLNRSLSDFGVFVNNIRYDIDLMQYLVENRIIKNFQALSELRGVNGHAASLLNLKDYYLDKIKDMGMSKLYFDVELPLSFVLYDMEREGVKVDESVLGSLSAGYVKEIEQLTKSVYDLVGEEFNILSTKQLSAILYDKLNLPKGKKIKTGFSTDNDALEKIIDRHPIVPMILKIRQLSKLNGTYAEGLKPLIKDGIIYTHFNQTLTTTGRLSSSDPNLQNIPVRDELGRELRKAFVPKNDLLISADYSQIELRLLAYFSGDQNLIESFKNGEDIHTRVASEILGIPPQMVTSSMRRTAKAVNFGIIYGISDFGLSRNIGTTVGKAKDYIKRYFERYPQIHKYLFNSIDKLKADGYVTTIMGRRRYIPQINSPNFALRSFGERAAMNMPLQGSAADLMKIAMVNVFNRFNQQGLKSKIIIQVHDELVVDALKTEEETVKCILKEEMQNAIKTEVPFDVNISSGENLYQAK